MEPDVVKIIMGVGPSDMGPYGKPPMEPGMHGPVECPNAEEALCKIKYILDDYFGGRASDESDMDKTPAMGMDEGKDMEDGFQGRPEKR